MIPLMIFKLILSFWLLRKTFYYSGVFLLLHAGLDIMCLIYNSYWLGTLSFILKPYILAACLAEVYESKLLRNINFVSLIGTMAIFIGLPFYGIFSHSEIHYIDLPMLTAFFAGYSLMIFWILGEKLLEFKKDTFPLLTALMLLIPEVIIFFQSKYVYLVINIINLGYYLGLLLFLLFASKYVKIVDDRARMRQSVD